MHPIHPIHHLEESMHLLEEDLLHGIEDVIKAPLPEIFFVLEGDAQTGKGPDDVADSPLMKRF